MSSELIGYVDKLSVCPGETIRFMISTDSPAYDASVVRLIHADTNPQGPGYKEEAITASVNRQYPGRKQTAYSGSYVIVENHPIFEQLDGLTLQAWIYPTLPQSGSIQGLVTKWSQSENTGFGLYINQSGELECCLGAGDGKVERVRTGKPLHTRQWYFVAATYEPQSGKISLYQHPLVVWPLDESAVTLETTISAHPLAANHSPVLIAAAFGETVSPDRVVGRGIYNGKIDSPRIFSRALALNEIESLKQGVTPQTVAGNAVIAAWNFAADFDTSRVTDSAPYQLHGLAVNMPMRAVTGHNWNGTDFDFKQEPAQYGAIYFHDDDLEDAQWEADFEWKIPDGLKSGFYAARLRSGDQEDRIPFFVRPRKGTATAPIAYLIPTLTYMAYANDRMRSFDEHAGGIKSHTVEKDPLDIYLAQHSEFAASLYDIHSDGSGYCYSSRLRPIVAMRPHYRFWIVGSSRHLAADLYLVDWLEHKDFAYDVITDEDLHNEGEALLTQYKTVVTGTHPEYWTTPMRDALEHYLDAGGRFMYLGGNGFYWVTSIDSTRPHIIEVRRGISGTRAWNSASGESYHSTTGEMGGLWRHRSKAPNQLVGIGFTAQGWEGQAPGYVRKPGSFDPRASFIFEGIGPEEVIGNFGLALGGAAGDELDRIDYSLGSPAHTLILASSSGHNQFILPVVEDVTEVSAAVILGKTGTVHADMVYFETPNNGAVFSTGSITWCGSLSHNHYNNNVSRITENVLRQFIK